MSFIKKTALPYVLMMTILLLVIALTTTSYFKRFIYSSWENELKTEVQLSTELVESATTFSNNEEINSLVSRLASATNDRVTIILPDGTVIGESEKNPSELENHLSRPEIQSALSGVVTAVIRTSMTVHTQLLYSAAPVIQDGKIVAVVRLAKPISAIEQAISRYKVFVSVIAAVGIALCLLLMFIQSSKTINPLMQVSEEIRKLSLGNASRIRSRSSRDEIETIISTVNSLIDRIDTQVASLQEERSKTNAILENMKDGVILADEKGKVTLINLAAAELFNVEIDSSIGKSLVEVVRDFHIMEVWKSTLQEKRHHIDLIQIGTHNENVQITAAPFQANKPGEVLFLFHDLTLIRKLQTIRQDFVSNVSHELRTPLTSLKVLTETLANGGLQDVKTSEHFLNQMSTEIDNLTQIVQELLELSKIESGRVPLNKTSISPDVLVKPVIERMELQAERAGIKLKNTVGSGLLPVLADVSRIQQVIVNLLHNAIKFTNPGGQIQLNAKEENGTVIFSIEDNGIGISEEDQSRIFERFYKTDRARASGGTGLGLSIARHIIEAHGGNIWVDSQLGKGSTFYFSIPLSTPNP
jgi:two-component system phosphate regulon sensor histidine kinase PhoR